MKGKAVIALLSLFLLLNWTAGATPEPTEQPDFPAASATPELARAGAIAPVTPVPTKATAVVAPDPTDASARIPAAAEPTQPDTLDTSAPPPATSEPTQQSIPAKTGTAPRTTAAPDPTKPPKDTSGSPAPELVEFNDPTETDQILRPADWIQEKNGNRDFDAYASFSAPDRQAKLEVRGLHAAAGWELDLTPNELADLALASFERSSVPESFKLLQRKNIAENLIFIACRRDLPDTCAHAGYLIFRVEKRWLFEVEAHACQHAELLPELVNSFTPTVQATQ